MYKKRWIADRLRKSLSVAPIIVLTGARQTGKTTLLRNEVPFKDFEYFTMDDLDVLSQAEKNPIPILTSGNNIIIDEVQKVPKIFPQIKSIIDREKSKKFVLSGSANFLLLKSISESLAGRATYHTLYPFAYSEEGGLKAPHWIKNAFSGIFPDKERKTPEEDIKNLIFRGFLPPVTKFKDSEKISIWWKGYVKTYIERDLRSLSNISSLGDFRNIMELIALRTGSIINQSSISMETGISQPTVHRYINLLEASHLFTKLRPFTKLKSKSIVKSPKGYFMDTGLSAYLSGIRESEEIESRYMGHLFESMIFENLLVLSTLLGFKICYWRTRIGKEREVDFVLEYKGKTIGIEVKLSQSVKYGDIQGLLNFIELEHNAAGGIIFYNGNKIHYLSENIVALPWYFI